MKSFITLLTLIPLSYFGLANNNYPEGFASVSALGVNGTTGGEGGMEITVTNAADFLTYAQSDDTLIIWVAGTIELTDMERVYSNKSVIGVGDLGVINGGGLDVFGGSNIIIRNLLFQNSSDDAIDVQHEGHHIWIDHNDLTSAYDGLCDIKHGSDYITVSWNKFYNHRKTCILGHSDNNGAQDSTHLLVSYHHNWFNGTFSRHPRVRFSGLTHVYNNYYNNNDYGIASTMEAKVLVENNYFYMVKDPTLVGYASSGPGFLVQTGNIFDNCTHAPEDSGTVPFPPYVYQLDSASIIPAIVQAGAGRAGFITSIENRKDIMANSIELKQNFPNPFNPTTTIEYVLSTPENVKITIINSLGEVVLEPVNEFVSQGKHQVLIGASQLSSGIYYYRLFTKNISQTRKMILLK